MPQNSDVHWGAGNKSPPDLDRILTQKIGLLKELLPGGSPSRFLIFLIVFFLGTRIWETLYSVPNDSVAVIQRFDKYTHDVSPVLRLKYPLGFHSATIVSATRQLKQEFGFFTPGAINLTKRLEPIITIGKHK